MHMCAMHVAVSHVYSSQLSIIQCNWRNWHNYKVLGIVMMYIFIVHTYMYLKHILSLQVAGYERWMRGIHKVYYS